MLVPLLFLIFFGCILSTNCDDSYFHRLDIVEGAIFPASVNAIVGDDIYIRLTHTVENQEHCMYRKPGGNDTNIPANALANSK